MPHKLKKELQTVIKNILPVSEEFSIKFPSLANNKSYFKLFLYTPSLLILSQPLLLLLSYTPTVVPQPLCPI